MNLPYDEEGKRRLKSSIAKSRDLSLRRDAQIARARPNTIPNERKEHGTFSIDEVASSCVITAVPYEAAR